MKLTSNPYGANFNVKVPPETITAQNSQASGKAKARYPNGEAQPVDSQAKGGKGPMKTRALTPGSSPTGS
jgi:hypothetical protein